MTDPMLPKGQKMRRTSDGHEMRVVASSEDWAIVRLPDAARGNARRVWRGEDGRFYDENGLDEWVPVTEPATWDVVPHGDRIATLVIEPSGRPGGWAVEVDPDRLPDHIPADDLAHAIAFMVEHWNPDVAYSAAADARRHRAAQTEREAQQ